MKTTLMLSLTLAVTASSALAIDNAWVASTGNDANPCTRAFPCATFQRAHDVTNAFGIVKAADAGEYGPLTINRAITIDGAFVGGIGTGSANAIEVLSGLGRVSILNLRINGRGVLIFSNTHLENVTIHCNSCLGVAVTPGPNVTAKNLTVTGALYGFSNNGGHVSIRDSVFRGCSTGVATGSGSGSLLLERSELSFNSDRGLKVGGSGSVGGSGTSFVRIADTVITGNTTGVVVDPGGTFLSFGNNMIAGNGNDGALPVSIPLK